MLRKGVYSYEYMDDWEKFSETSLPENEDFTVTLTWKILLMQIMHTEKEFVRILNLREYHEVYVQNNTLFLADVFENLWNMSSGIWNLPSSFFIALGLAWQGAFKKTKAKLDFWTNTDKLLMVKKRRNYVTLFIAMQKLITNTWNIIIKKNLHILNIGMQIICMVGQWHKRCLQISLRGLRIFLNLIQASEKIIKKKVMRDILSWHWISWKFT